MDGSPNIEQHPWHVHVSSLAGCYVRVVVVGIDYAYMHAFAFIY